MRRVIGLGVIGLALTAGAAADWTINWTDIDSYHTLGDPENVVIPFWYTGEDFTIGTLTWDGFGEAFDGSYASEARLHVTTPSGTTTSLQLASGTSGPFVSGGSSDFFSGMQAAGTWVFEFYETYDDPTPNPDATHYELNLTFAEYVEPPTMADASLGTIPVGTCVYGDTTGHTDDFGWSYGWGDDVWTVEHAGGDLVLDLTWDGLPSGPDIDLRLYDATESQVAYSFAVPGPENITLEDLAAGTYYALVDGYDGEDAYELCYTPEPASLTLLLLAGLICRRR